MKPWIFFQASYFQLLKLENLLRWSFFSFIHNRSTHMILFHLHFTSNVRVVPYICRGKIEVIVIVIEYVQYCMISFKKGSLRLRLILLCYLIKSLGWHDSLLFWGILFPCYYSDDMISQLTDTFLSNYHDNLSWQWYFDIWPALRIKNDFSILSLFLYR